MRSWTAALGVAAVLAGTGLAAAPAAPAARSGTAGVAGDGSQLAPALQASGSRPSVGPADDLDGDRIPDLQAQDVASGLAVGLAATDGRHLALPAVPGAGTQVAVRALDVDVTGDGRPDVLRLAVADRVVDRSCSDLGACTESVTWTWVVGVHDHVGAPARVEHRVPAAARLEDNAGSTQGLVRRVRSWEGTADRVEVRVPSHRGRGRLWVTALSTSGSLDHAGLVGQAPRLREVVTAASLTALDAAGRAVATRALPLGPDREEYVPLGDLDGDGRPEVALLEPDGDRGARMARVLGPDLAARWSQPLHPATNLQRGEDAGGHSRVLRRSPGIVSVLDGRDGREVLTPDRVRVAAPRGVGPVPAMAYEVVDGEVVEGEGRAVSLRIGAYDLRRGGFHGFQREHQLGRFESGAGPGAFTGADLDGDGRMDLVGQEMRGDGSGGRLLALTASGTAFTGPVEQYAVPWRDLQLDGAAGLEVLLKQLDENDGVWTGVVAYRPGQRLWRQPRSVFDLWTEVRLPDGSDFAEAGVDGRGRPQVRVLDGVALDVRWTTPLG